MRGPCINRSSAQRWLLEDGLPHSAIRCSLAYVRTVANSARAVTLERRARGPFGSLEEFCRRCHFLSREQLEWLALAGALDCVAPNRRQALWTLPVLHQDRTGQRRRMLDNLDRGQEALEMPDPLCRCRAGCPSSRSRRGTGSSGRPSASRPRATR